MRKALWGTALLLVIAALPLAAVCASGTQTAHSASVLAGPVESESQEAPVIAGADAEQDEQPAAEAEAEPVINAAKAAADASCKGAAVATELELGGSVAGACPHCADETASQSADYEFFGPLAITSQHPPALLFLSPLPEAATTLPAGGRTLELRLEWTNLIIRELDSGVIVDYDFETLRPTLGARWGLGGGELSASLPYIYRGHGALDSVIAEWHDWFALPNGLRTRFPDGQYRYTIVTREGPVFNDDGDSAGLGDLSLWYKLELLNRDCGREALSWRAGVKAPLGDPEQALGSGGWDFGLGLLYQLQLGERWRAYANFDYVFVGEPDWRNVGHQDMLVKNLALEYALCSNWTLAAQYRQQTNPLRFGSYEADKDPQELALGFNHRVSPGLVWSGGFSEDIYPETAPDFVVFSQLKWGF